jgi:hypothetical protein
MIMLGEVATRRGLDDSMALQDIAEVIAAAL